MNLQTSPLDTPIEYLKGVGPKKGEILRKEAGIGTLRELIYYFPFRHIDRSRFVPIAAIDSDAAYIMFRGKVMDVEIAGKAASERLVVTVNDGTGQIDLVFFKGLKWIKDKFAKGTDWVVFGKPAVFNGRYNMTHPETEPLSEFVAQPAEPLFPVYPSTEKMKSAGLNSRLMAKIVRQALAHSKGYIKEVLSLPVKESFKVIGREQAINQMHFPADTAQLQQARHRMIMEELFFLQLRILRYKIFKQEKSAGFKFQWVGSAFNDFYHHHLPFPLTNAQKKVMHEIRADMGSGRQMNRLLQGDVGSGKTLVALMSMLIALDNGYQACLMAPTEILAAQHYQTLSRLLAGMPLQVDLLTGSTRKSQRNHLHRNLQDGQLHILIGTHALIEDRVEFKNLGFVVIDEQHRFGVAQRAQLWQKTEIPPHVLVMTATPIPRTLAMTVYGDLEVSVIDELPPGRKPVQTYHFYEKGREKVYRFMHKQLIEGRQVYIVYPLIEESAALDLRNAVDGFEHLKVQFPEPRFKVGLLHGKMKAEEKESVMGQFKKGELNILVATTVIEVGVDVPNASVMVIENAERFGLSQLHQLRGRVGRGAEQSYCVLMSSYELSSDGKKRLETMVRTNDGFEIANVDLKLRGPGDLEGTRQSGILDLKVADIVRDEALLRLAREKAIAILAEDPLLSTAPNQCMAEQLASMDSQSQNWARIS